MSNEALQPGQLIEDTYRIVRRVGEGGMGEVYEAAHARLSGRYAIKLLLREVASDPTLMARFQREAQITSSLRHPNIVQVLDFRQLPSGVPYIVMEFLDGVDLATEIRKGPMPLPRVQALLEQIASGLAAAHEQGIIHRDLKPANLFLVVLPGSHSELVKIVDFGISKARAANTQLTHASTVMGTPQYMAPEQAMGQGDRLDARADQFALATIAYEMIAGRCAFAGDSIPMVLYQLLHTEPPPLLVQGQPISPAVDAVIRRGLAKRPEDRYASVLDFAHAFGAAVAGGASREASLVSSVAQDRTLLAPLDASPASGLPKGQALAPGPSTFEPVAARGTAARTSARPAAGKRMMVVGGAAIALCLLGMLIFLRGHGTASSPAATATPGGTAKPARPTAPVPVPDPAAAEVQVDVQDAPANLVVSIDGDDPRPLPAQLIKGSGTHQLVFQAPGYQAKTMQLDANQDLMLVLSLKKLRRTETGKGRAEPPIEQAEKSNPGRFRRSFNAVKHVWLGN
jgi:tRNA A-37 threonylcarbamoyl transferase component Bud32